MAEKSYTILIVPDSSSKFRKVVIPRYLISAGLVLLGLLVVGFFFLLQNHIASIENYQQGHQLLGEVKYKLRKMAELRAEMAEVEETLSRLSEFGNKMRSFAGLKTIKEIKKGVGKSGVGGPDEATAEEKKSVLEKEKQSFLDVLEGDITELSSKATRQEENFLRTVEFFSRKSDVIFSTPSIWPTRGWISSGFGYRVSPFTGRRQFHEGIDIASNYGSIVRAPGDGTVTYVGRKRGYGRVLEINHGNGYVTRYAHNARILVKRGKKVKRGDPVAKVGSSGLTTGPHLHYEVRYKGRLVNPIKYIFEEVAENRR